MARTYGVTPDIVYKWPLFRWQLFKSDMDREIAESRKAAARVSDGRR